MAVKKLFDLHENIYYQKSQFEISELECEKEFWNVDETISELAYLTHDYFRYYGKFPSKVGKMILEDLIKGNVIDKEKDFVIDNYAGSGTTLVEAKLAGIDSVGLDINPFAVLACRVKTYNYDVSKLRKTANTEFLKWFSDKVIQQLVIIKDTLLEMDYSKEREFFDLGFFAIIRRVSYAHDAEVRPHVNKKKRKRDAIEAFSKKITEMLDTMDEWNSATCSQVYSNAYLT